MESVYTAVRAEKNPHATASTQHKKGLKTAARKSRKTYQENQK